MLGFQKDLAAIYDIQKENFKTPLNLTKKENSLFSRVRECRGKACQL